MIRLTLVILSLAMIPRLGFAAGASCAHCDELRRFENDMSKVQADALDADTIDQQDALVDRGSQLITTVLRDEAMSQDTAEELLVVMAKLVPFDNAGISMQDNYALFSRQYNRKSGNVLKPALTELVRKHRLTAQERRDLLEEYNVR
jgi:hypothetical protein